MKNPPKTLPSNFPFPVSNSLPADFAFGEDNGAAMRAASVQRNAQPTEFEKQNAPFTGNQVMSGIKNFGSDVKDMAIGMAMGANKYGSALPTGANPAVAAPSQVLQSAANVPEVAPSVLEHKSLGDKVVDLMGGNSGRLEAASQHGDIGGTIGASVMPIANAAMLGRGVSAGKAALMDALPSTERAGANFAAAAAKANPVPIQTAAVNQSAQAIQDMADAGAQMPAVVRKFIKRVTDPNLPPVDYEEARRFYQNASGKMSLNESSRLTPKMKRLLGQFTSDLGESIAGAADDAGVLPEHQAAMQEYRQAMKLRGYSDATIKVLLKAGLAAAPGAGMLYAINKAAGRRR